jgi:hypothetical protein
MEFISAFLKKRTQVIEKKVSFLLNEDVNTNFLASSLNSNQDLLHEKDSQLSQKEKALLAFSNLIPYFEAGILLTTTGDRNVWIPELAFKAGRFYPHLTEDLAIGIQLPNLNINQVAKMNVANFVKKLELTNLITHPEVSGVVVGVDENIRYVLISQLAEPWLRMQIENLQESLLRAKI